MRNVQRRAETRAAILNAAAECFMQKGYNETGVAEICRRAAVSKGAFYYHFESKEAVFLELLNNWLAELERTLEASAGRGGSIPETLLEMAELTRGAFRDERRRISIFLELWTQAARNEKVRKATLEPYRKYQRILEELIGRGIREGSLKPVKLASGAQAIVSLASGLFLQALLDPEGKDWSKVLRESILIMLDGLRKEENTLQAGGSD